MLDLKFLRENPDVVKQNIKNKFQDSKLALVDEVIALDEENRRVMQEADELRSNRNKISKQIGALMGQGKKEEAAAVKAQVAAEAGRVDELSVREKEVEEQIKKIMMTIPISSILPYRSVRMTVRTWKFRSTVSLWFLNTRSLIMPRSWKALTVWIWTVPVR